MQSKAMQEDRAALFIIPTSFRFLALFTHARTDTIRRLVEQSAGRIEIAAGGGVDEATVGELGMPFLSRCIVHLRV
jgi:hypothetical protein